MTYLAIMTGLHNLRYGQTMETFITLIPFMHNMRESLFLLWVFHLTQNCCCWDELFQSVILPVQLFPTVLVHTCTGDRPLISIRNAVMYCLNTHPFPIPQFT